MGEVVLREFAPCHLEALAALERACFSTPWTREQLAQELQNEQAEVLVAMCGESVAGYAGMHTVLDEGYITNVAVLPAFRRRGIARALLRGLKARGGGRLSFITLEVRESNAAAIALYRSEGFAPAGRRKAFYSAPKEDALLLTWRPDGEEGKKPHADFIDRDLL